jgi:hypothetical protein
VSWQHAAEVRDSTRERFSNVAEVADESLRLLDRALELGVHGQRLETWGEVVSMSGCQVWSTLNCAWELTFAGYFVQAFALARLAFEYQTLCTYIDLHRAEAEAWLRTSPAPKQAGHLAETLYRQWPAESEALRDVKKILHRFAHIDLLGFAGVADRREGRRRMWLGPTDETWHIPVLASLLTLIARGTFQPVSRLGAEKNGEWSRELARHIATVDRVLSAEEMDRGLDAAIAADKEERATRDAEV